MTTPALTTARVLASRPRLRILRALRSGEGDAEWSVDRVAEAMGVHANTAREHLQALEYAGFVSSRPMATGGRGRPPLLYRACIRPAGATLDERLRAQMLDLLLASYGPDDDGPDDDGPDAREGADARGTSAAQDARPDAPQGDGADQATNASAGSLASRPQAARQVAHLELHFEDLGFDPEVSEDPLTLHFTRCPLMSLARSDTELVCRVHEDLAQDVLAQQPGPVEVGRLEPFVEPHHCVLHLRDRDVPGTTE